MRKFAISDIHGCAKTFDALLDRIALTTNDQLYLLGDFIDRGPDSKGVIDQVFDLKEKGYQVECLVGNHEERVLKARTDVEILDKWTAWGGQATLDSFGANTLEDIPPPYWEFMENLQIYFRQDEYLMVHAGLNFKLDDPMQDKYAMVWIRDWYADVNYDWLGNQIIIHGHIQQNKDEIHTALEQLDERKILGIDNGCATRNVVGRGNLCAFELTNRKVFFVPNRDY